MKGVSNSELSKQKGSTTETLQMDSFPSSDFEEDDVRKQSEKCGEVEKALEAYLEKRMASDMNTPTWQKKNKMPLPAPSVPD